MSILKPNKDAFTRLRDVVEDACSSLNKSLFKKPFNEETTTKIFLNGTFNKVEVKLTTKLNEDGQYEVTVNVIDINNSITSYRPITVAVDNAIVNYK